MLGDREEPITGSEDAVRGEVGGGGHHLGHAPAGDCGSSCL